VEARPLTGVTTRMGSSPSSGRCSVGLQNILYYINTYANYEKLKAGRAA